MISLKLASARKRVTDHHAQKPMPPPGTAPHIIAAGLRDHNNIAKNERKRLGDSENEAKALQSTFEKLKKQAQIARNQGLFPNAWMPTGLEDEFRGRNGLQVQAGIETKLSSILAKINAVRPD